MATMGRPRALDDSKRREICALVAAGCGIGGAAGYVGCTPTTIRREALRNEDFHEALRRAELSAQLNPLRAMQQAASKHWRAAAWMLERTGPQRFVKLDTKRMEVEQVKHLLDQMLQYIGSAIDDESLRRKIHCQISQFWSDWGQNSWAMRTGRRDPKRARRKPRCPPPLPDGFDDSDDFDEVPAHDALQKEIAAETAMKTNPANELPISSPNDDETSAAPKTPESSAENAPPQT